MSASANSFGRGPINSPSRLLRAAARPDGAGRSDDDQRTRTPTWQVRARKVEPDCEVVVYSGTSLDPREGGTDSVRYELHKVFLASGAGPESAGSAHFRTVFKNSLFQPLEPGEPLPSTTLRLPAACAGPCFASVLTYLYTGQVEPAASTAVSLLWCAATLQIDDLQEKVASFVLAQLSPATALPFLVQAVRIGLPPRLLHEPLTAAAAKWFAACPAPEAYAELPADAFLAVVEHETLQKAQQQQQDADERGAASSVSRIVTDHYLRSKQGTGSKDGCLSAETVVRCHAGLRRVRPEDALCWVSSAVAAGVVGEGLAAAADDAERRWSPAAAESAAPSSLAALTGRVWGAELVGLLATAAAGFTRVKPADAHGLPPSLVEALLQHPALDLAGGEDLPAAAGSGSGGGGGSEDPVMALLTSYVEARSASLSRDERWRLWACCRFRYLSAAALARFDHEEIMRRGIPPLLVVQALHARLAAFEAPAAAAEAEPASKDSASQQKTGEEPVAPVAYHPPSLAPRKGQAEAGCVLGAVVTRLEGDVAGMKRELGRAVAARGEAEVVTAVAELVGKAAEEGLRAEAAAAQQAAVAAAVAAQHAAVAAAAAEKEALRQELVAARAEMASQKQQLAASRAETAAAENKAAASEAATQAATASLATLEAKVAAAREFRVQQQQQPASPTTGQRHRANSVSEASILASLSLVPALQELEDKAKATLAANVAPLDFVSADTF
eukprot:SAG22_NODE_717_length_7707_cov_3.098186_2_plen_731_part_00